MKKFALMILLGVAAMLAFAPAARAGGSGGLKAVVIKVAPTYIVLDKENSGRRYTYNIDEDSSFTIGGQDAKPSDVKPGQHVLFTINKANNSIKTLDVQDAEPPADAPKDPKNPKDKN